MSSSFSSSAKGVPNEAEYICAVTRQRPNFDYDPPIYYNCKQKKKSAMWTSWSDEHPGMRFISRRNCKFFMWYDDKILGRAKEVVKGLRDHQRELHEKNIELQSKVEGLLFELDTAKHLSARDQSDLSMEIDNLTEEIRRMDSCNRRQLRRLLHEVDELRKNNKASTRKIKKLLMGICILFFCFVWFLIFA